MMMKKKMRNRVSRN